MAIKRRGAEVDEVLNKKGVDFKKAIIRLKDGEGVRVRILSPNDYVEYDSHGSFTKSIYTQPCAGEDCPLCLAYKEGGEEWKDLKVTPRYVFAFGDLDTGEIRFWDASKSQARKLISQIKEYKDDLGEFAFNFKRTGSGKSTDYSLNLIPRLKKEDEVKFKVFDGMVVEDELFEAVCSPRPKKYMVKALKEAGFPVEKYFADILAELESAETETTENEEDLF